MTLHISLTDFAQKLSQQTGKHIDIHQSREKQITISYLIDVKLNLMEHNHHSLKFTYELPWGASWLLKIFSHINSKKFTLNTSDKTVWLHLNEFGEYRNALIDKTITSASMHNNTLVLLLADAAS